MHIHTYISMLVSLVVVAAMATLGEPSPTGTEGIVLIGAGFGRTGTASTKKALELLDIGPTHHMVEVTSCTVCVYTHTHTHTHIYPMPFMFVSPRMSTSCMH